MEKLISMVDFVLEQIEERNKEPEYDSFEFMENVSKYANFLKQPLNLSMFVTCDLNGNVLEEPTQSDHFRYANGIEFYPHQKEEYLKIYQEAKERVLFEPQYQSNTKELWLPNGGNISSLCIHDLIALNYNLTEAAKKQIS